MSEARLRRFALFVFFALFSLTEAAAAERPSGRILFQPQFLWADSDTTLQGTGYVIEYGGRYYGATSIHFLNFNVGGLRHATWLDVASQAPVATFMVSLGRPSRTSITLLRHAAEDFILLPAKAALEDTTALELESVPRYPAGTRLWFPNKDRDVKHGHTWMDATVVEDAGSYIEVRLDGMVPMQSQSGSPLLNAETGKVAGMIQSGEEKDGRLILYLCPARALVKHLARKPANMSLMTSISRRR